LEVHIVDPKKKNIIMVSVAVLVIGYAGYSMLFGGDSSKAQDQTRTLVKKTRAPVEGLAQRGAIKKKPTATATKKTGLVKKDTLDRKKSTLKKRPGKRGGRKTKKKEVAPAA